MWFVLVRPITTQNPAARPNGMMAEKRIGLRCPHSLVGQQRKRFFTPLSLTFDAITILLHYSYGLSAGEGRLTPWFFLI